MLSSIPEILEDLRRGRPIILVDDEDRENEGDLVCAAEKITPAIINFVTRHTPGYLCVALTAVDCDRLELHAQAASNTALRGTAMAVSVGWRLSGVSTSFASAPWDRSSTIDCSVSGWSTGCRPPRASSWTPTTAGST